MFQEFIETYICNRIDQAEVGANSRSTPATYTGIMDEIRKGVLALTYEPEK